MKNADLGNGNIKKLLFSLSLPSIAAQLINLMYNLVDRMYIGRIKDVGAMALTGVGVAMPIIMIISAFAALIGMGGAPRAAIMMGKQDNDSAERLLGSCFVTLILISVILTAVILLNLEPLLKLFGASGVTVTYAADYMRIYASGTVFVQTVLGLNAFISGQGFAKTSMATVIIGAVINIILDPIFIFVFGMGVKGAALATIISQAISAIWVLKFLFGKTTVLKINLKNCVIVPSLILPVMALGVSPFIMQVTESAIAICFNTSLRAYGTDIEVGAMTVLTSVMQFALLPLTGLTQGAQPITSYNFGAKQYGRVKEVFFLLLRCCVIYTTIFWALIMLFPDAFMKIFTNDPALIERGAWALRIYMSVIFIFGIQMACQQTFVSLGNAKYSLFLAVLRKIVLLIPLIYIVPNFCTDKVFGVFLAEPIADAAAVTVTSIVFAKEFKKVIGAKQLEQDN